MSVQPPRDRQPHRSAPADIGGETLGTFRLLEEIASGELASFWRARSLEGADDAAPLLIKRLRREHSRSPEYRSALQREAELASTFRAAGFVRTLSFDRSPELFVVMEHIEGANLAVLLAAARRHDTESTRFALPLIVDALHALDYLHRGHDATGATCLTHQAPVARHILAGVDGSARLIDFTLAMGPSTPRAPLCDHRLQPAEMAPEQVLAPSMVDPRADIFIMGITLWETLTGQRLFDGKNPLESQRRMLSGSIGLPSEASAGVHRAFDRICRRALARPRGERYANAKEMAGELRDEAMRAGVWAEQAEVGAWVRNTVALGRSVPRTVPQNYARSEAAQTMMGLGGPSPAVLSIADSYRQTQPGHTARGGRKSRNSGAPNQPVRRESTIPITDAADATSLITRGRSQPPAEPAHDEPLRQVAVPDISRLGSDLPHGGVNDSAYETPRVPRPKYGLVVMCVLGVTVAGLGAYFMRTRQDVGASAPRVFEPAVAAPAPLEATPAPALAAPATLPPAAWPPADVPAAVEPPRAEEKVPFAPPVAVPQPVPQAPVAVPHTPAAPPPVAVQRKPAPARKIEQAPVRTEPVPARSAEPAAPARKSEQPLRWDVASTLSGAKPNWSKPAPAADAPSWNASEAKQPAPEKQPSSAPSDLPINPY